MPSLGRLSAESPLPSSFELLDDEPHTFSRPLALIDGRAYAATWLLGRYQRPIPGARRTPAQIVLEPTSVAEYPPTDQPSPDPVIRYEQPGVETLTERRLYVVRDDGVVFGDGADAPLADLGLSPDLEEPPRTDRLWRRAAVERYRAGARPDAADLFTRLVACYDTFVSFERSVADQRTMCELGACLSLATWLADAFAVVPYLWIAGERGSGKTQLGTIWAQTSYLGEIVLAGGSYPALRDLAQLGAALYFDDAEALAGGRGDAFKRELLLAGNRRGARVPLKTLHGDRWRTRWVSAFTPRAFSAIAPPDPTLASRAVVIPLARTLDSTRGQRDPADDASWPCDRAVLQDDCWAFGLSSLCAAAAAWRELERETAVVGRDFERWRPLLATASIVESAGVSGLADRLRAAMLAYDRAPDEDVPDETREVVEGLVHLAEFTLSRAAERHLTREQVQAACRKRVFVKNSAILAAIQLACPEGTLATSPDQLAAPRLGRIMRRLRFEGQRAPTVERTRGFTLSIEEILRLSRAYRVPTVLDRLLPRRQ